MSHLLSIDKLLIIILIFFCGNSAYSQNEILVFKKGKKIIERYWKGSEIAFLQKNGDWRKGNIKKIKDDSIYIQPVIVYFGFMRTDTVHYAVQGFSLADIYAMPKNGILIDYKDGSFQISRSGGHVHWYWIKSGLLFRFGAAGYAALHVLNGLNKGYELEMTNLEYAAGVFGLGVFLKYMYKPYLRMGKRYHFEVLKL